MNFRELLKRCLCMVALCFWVPKAIAGRINGLISDQDGNSLSYASILVKGSSKGAVANSSGRYTLYLDPGTYTLVCQHIGYRAEEKIVTVNTTDLTVNFQLSLQVLTMEEVVIKRGPDPALEIMRQAIKKRNFYNEQVDSLTVDVYIKALLRSKGLPLKKNLDEKDKLELAKQGLDSSGKGILFLSESVTKVSLKKPDKVKYRVLSSRQSGGGLGISIPFFINFYTNNVSIFDNRLNPRGFISPIADNAFHYYKFHYEGNFFEGQKMIDRIKVTPRRKNEPLFNGYIQIIDGEWKIHSLDLVTSTQYRLELFDTLRITQTHAPVTDSIWRIQNQVVYLSMKKLGFDVAGNFLNVYSNYNLAPVFGNKYYNRIIMTYDSAFNKKDSNYWSNNRPVPLEWDEKKNYSLKDSLEFLEKNSKSLKSKLDSLNKRPVTLSNLLAKGVLKKTYSPKAHITYSLQPLLTGLEYNTVEGASLHIDQSLEVQPKNGNKILTAKWNTRYGFSNEHLNAYLAFTIRSKEDSFRNRYLVFSGGKRISQFNQENPIDPLTNSIYTLLYKRNYIKLYENWFGNISYHNRFENGLELNLGATYEDRIPLENTTDFSFFKKERNILPNHPYELAHIPFDRNQAAVASVTLSYQPGQHYIQFPDNKLPVGSGYPTFQLQYVKGIPEFLGSDAHFDKWRLSVFDQVSLKLGGEFRYKISMGGFLNNTHVDIPDFQHFNGNQTFWNDKYLNSFQLAPYYRYSNTEKWYALAHVEQHFHGLLTNKIPLFNKLKWNLVIGSNAFYVNRNNYYIEAFAGIENIFKIYRLDFIRAYQSQSAQIFGVRMGVGGLLADLLPKK